MRFGNTVRKHRFFLLNPRQKSSAFVDVKNSLRLRRRSPLEKRVGHGIDCSQDDRKINYPAISETLSTACAPTKTVSNNLLVFLLNCTQWHEVAAVFKEALFVTWLSLLRWSCSAESPGCVAALLLQFCGFWSLRASSALSRPLTGPRGRPPVLLPPSRSVESVLDRSRLRPLHHLFCSQISAMFRSSRSRLFSAWTFSV